MQLFLILAAAQVGAPAEGAAGALLQHRILPLPDACGQPDRGEEIVICGRPDRQERYRVPEEFRDQAEPGQRIRGIGTASLDAEPFAPCGIFQGQRRCSKADAAEFGYGNGRDPITVAGKIIAEITNPD